MSPNIANYLESLTQNNRSEALQKKKITAVILELYAFIAVTTCFSKTFPDIISGLSELDQFETLFYSFMRFLLEKQKMATLTDSKISVLTNS